MNHHWHYYYYPHPLINTNNGHRHNDNNKYLPLPIVVVVIIQPTRSTYRRRNHHQYRLRCFPIRHRNQRSHVIIIIVTHTCHHRPLVRWLPKRNDTRKIKRTFRWWRNGTSRVRYGIRIPRRPRPVRRRIISVPHHHQHPLSYRPIPPLVLPFTWMMTVDVNNRRQRRHDKNIGPNIVEGVTSVSGTPHPRQRPPLLDPCGNIDC